MRVFLSVALLLLSCVRDSGGSVLSETDRGVKNEHEASQKVMGNCQPDMCELLMKIGAMENRLEDVEAMEARLKATEQLVAVLQTKNEAIEMRLSATESMNEDTQARLVEAEMQVARLQTENEAMEARLKATEQLVSILQTENEAMEARLKATEQMVTILQTKNEEQTAAVDIIASQLTDVVTRLTSCEIHLDQLLESSVTSKVAFSAGLGSTGHYGPFNSDKTLAYGDVHTNFGNAYSPNTGTFTALFRGVYHFSYYHHHGGGRGGRAHLYKNKEERLAGSDSYNRDSYTTANGVTVLLEEGDEVSVVLAAGHWLYDDGNNWSNFNGFLLFTL